MRKYLTTGLIALLIASLCLLSACGGQQTAERDDPASIIVASKIDTEGALLGQMIILLLEDQGFSVIDRTELGPTDIMRRSLTSGEIDLYPEYTGNGAFFFPETDPAIWKDFDEGYRLVKQLDEEENNIAWLTPAPANNTWAIAVKKDMAGEKGLYTMEDFASYVRAGGQVKLAASEEFVTSPAALPAFAEAYDFDLSGNQLLTLAGGNTAQTAKALAEGTDGVNFAMAYGTDGALAALNLLILEDSKNVQPVYAPTAIIRGELLEEHPEIETILHPAFAGLDLETLQELNGRIVVQGEAAVDVARDYLLNQGLLSL